MKRTNLKDYPEYLLIKKAIVTLLNCAIRKKNVDFNGRRLHFGFSERVATWRFDRVTSAGGNILALLFYGRAGTEAAFTIVAAMK